VKGYSTVRHIFRFTVPIYPFYPFVLSSPSMLLPCSRSVACQLRSDFVMHISARLALGLFFSFFTSPAVLTCTTSSHATLTYGMHASTTLLFYFTLPCVFIFVPIPARKIKSLSGGLGVVDFFPLCVFLSSCGLISFYSHPSISYSYSILRALRSFSLLPRLHRLHFTCSLARGQAVEVRCGMWRLSIQARYQPYGNV